MEGVDSVKITNQIYPDNTKHPYFLEGARLLTLLAPNLSIDTLARFANDIGVTGTASLSPFLFFRPDLWPNLGVETIVHDILSLVHLAIKDKTGESPEVLEDVYGYGFDSVVLSAIWVPTGGIISEIEDILFTSSEQPFREGVFGAAVGTQISTYLADDNFASQLVAQSVGSTVGNWVGKAIEFEGDLDNIALETIALPEILISQLGSVTVSLGAGELSQELIEKLKIEDKLAQIAVGTLSQAVVNYAFTSAVRTYFPQLGLKYLGIQQVSELTTKSLLTAYEGAVIDYAASYAGAELYEGAPCSMECY